MVCRLQTADHLEWPDDREREHTEHTDRQTQNTEPGCLENTEHNTQRQTRERDRYCTDGHILYAHHDGHTHIHVRKRSKISEMKVHFLFLGF